jgi:multimeric flavodoxin WrbA
MKIKPDTRIENDHSPEKRVFGLSGSPRKGGNSDVLLKHILKGVRQNEIPTERVRLCNYQYQPCIGCEKCRKDNMCTGLNDGMHLLYPKVIESQGIVLVCPTHNYNVTAWMKAFIDRLYCLYIFDNSRPRGWSSRLTGQNRKAVIAAVCEQVDKKDMGFTIEAMRLPIEALGYEVVGELAVFGIFDKGKVQDEDETLTKAIKLGNQLAISL